MGSSSRSRGLAGLLVLLGLSGLSCSSSGMSSAGASGDGGAGGGSGSSGAASSGGQSGDASQSGVAFTVEKMQIGGTTRQYVLGVPADYDAAKRYPLVLSLHGQPGSGAGQHQAYPFEKASGNAAIVVYPDGTNGEWDLYGVMPDNADIPFLQALVDDLATRYSIDKSRVFGTGYSNGAFMVNQMACRLAGFFKAIASHAGGAPDEPNVANPARFAGNNCLRCPGGPTPAIMFHGDADPVVPFSGGNYDATCWGANNGCQDTRSDTTPSPCQRVDGCPSGSPVEWCPIPGLGHVEWTEGSATAWGFFQSLP